MQNIDTSLPDMPNLSYWVGEFELVIYQVYERTSYGFEIRVMGKREDARLYQGGSSYKTQQEAYEAACQALKLILDDGQKELVELMKTGLSSFEERDD